MIRFYDYIEGVKSGKYDVGNYIKLAIKRHEKDLKNSKFYFDEKEAERIIKFAEICRHWKGAKAGERIVLEPHQVFYLGSLYGWRVTQTKLRRFTTSYKEVARKSYKTTESAVKAIYHILFEEKEGAQVWCGATKEDQARIVVNDAGKIIQRTPELSSLGFKFTSYQGQVKRVIYAKSGSYISPLGRDSNTQDGFDPSYGIIDEYHAHKTDELLNVIEGGMGLRQNPLMDIITTAGFNKDYPCYSVLRKVCIDILEGTKTDDTLFCMIFTPDKDIDWKDERAMIQSNPNYIYTPVKQKYLKDRLLAAINEGGSKEVELKTKNLNIWTDAPEIWISLDKWQLNTHNVNIENLKDKHCYLGIDLGKSNDINALVWFFHSFVNEKGVKIYPIYCHFFIPEAKLKSKDDLDFRKWVDDGFITVTPGETVDHDFIASYIDEKNKDFKVDAVCYDPYIATHKITGRLTQMNLKAYALTQTTPYLSPPTKKIEEMILNAKFEHFNNPVMRWMLGNCKLYIDGNENIRLSKINSSGRIDGFSALVNAVAYYLNKDLTNKIYKNELFVM